MARVVGLDVVFVEFADVMQPVAASAREDAGTAAAGGAERLERVLAIAGRALPGAGGGW